MNLPKLLNPLKVKRPHAKGKPTAKLRTIFKNKGTKRDKKHKL